MINFEKISELGLSGFFRSILIILAFSAALSYILHYFTGSKYIIPGDLYKIKAPKRIYIPFGSTLLLTIAIFIILSTKILGLLLSIGAIYIAYRAIFKGGL